MIQIFCTTFWTLSNRFDFQLLTISSIFSHLPNSLHNFWRLSRSSSQRSSLVELVNFIILLYMHVEFYLLFSIKYSSCLYCHHYYSLLLHLYFLNWSLSYHFDCFILSLKEYLTIIKKIYHLSPSLSLWI